MATHHHGNKLVGGHYILCKSLHITVQATTCKYVTMATWPHPLTELTVSLLLIASVSLPYDAPVPIEMCNIVINHYLIPPL